MTSFSKHLAFVAAFAVALSGCASGSGSSVPSGTQGVQAPSAGISDAATTNLSGQYAGTVKDSTDGTGKATVSVAQYKTALGGDETIVFTHATVTDSVVLAASAKGLDGTTVLADASVVCSYSTIAAYDAKTRVLSGSYKAVHGCSGETGTFTLKHKCIYLDGKADVRPEGGAKPC
jgi:hypothetical protein